MSESVDADSDGGLLDSVRQVLNARLKSRFTGAFILSWSVANWKIFYLTIFVSSKDIEGNKLDYITSNYLDVNLVLWWPLIAAITITLIAPILNGLSNNWHEVSSGWIKAISMNIAKKTPIDRKEYETLLDKFKEFEIDKAVEMQKLRENATEERERLEASIAELNDENSILRNQIKEPKKEDSQEVIQLPSEHYNRMLNRLVIDLRSMLKKNLKNLADEMWTGNKDTDELSKIFINHLDKIRAEVNEYLKTKKFLDSKVVIKAFNDKLFKLEDDVDKIVPKIEKFTYSLEPTTEALLNSFASIYEFINSIEEDKLNEEK